MSLKPGDYGFYDRSAEIVWVSGGAGDECNL